MSEKEQIEEQEDEVQNFELVSKTELDEGELARTKPLEIDGYKVEIIAEEFDKELSANDIYQDLLKVEAHLCGTEDLISYADKWDCIFSVISGIICGTIDSVFVGKWDFKSAKAESDKEIEEKVIEFAKKHPDYQDFINRKKDEKNRDPDILKNAIEFLEKNYKLPGDGTYKEDKSGLGINDKTHHLDDFCHHPTLIGLICCVLVQFTGETQYVNSSSEGFHLPIEVNNYGNFVGNNAFAKFFAGLINWFKNVAGSIENWQGHLMSDVAGTSGSKKGGAGLPGPIMSTLKELSAIPCFKDTNFGENLRKAFQNGIGDGKKQLNLGVFNTLFEGASSKVDLRTEIAVKKELDRQAFPVMVNEVLVRGFYFLRHFIDELKRTNSVLDLDWEKVMPFKNRTILRMLTISKGTFEVFDLGDAAIRGAIDSKGSSDNFAKEFLLRVNFVGATSFVVTVATDAGMGIKKIYKEWQYENQKCLKLIRLYEKNAEGLSLIFKDVPETKELSGPLFLHFDEPRYEKQNFKIMFVGTDNNMKLSYIPVRKESDLILPLFEECKNFEIVNTKFGSFARKITKAMNENSQEKDFILWNSIFKFSKHTPNIESAESQNFNLLLKEIKICKPDAVIFMTGSKYDDYISSRLGGSIVFENICKKQVVNINDKKIKLPNMSEKKFAKVSCSELGLPEHIYRVSNPKSLLFFLKKKNTFKWLIALMGGSAEWEEEDKEKKTFAFKLPKKLLAILAVIIVLVLLSFILRDCQSCSIQKSSVIEPVAVEIQDEPQLVVEKIVLEEQKSAYFVRDSKEFEDYQKAQEWLDLMAAKIKKMMQENSNMRFKAKGCIAEFDNDIDGAALSNKRAEVIKNGLVERGVPDDVIEIFEANNDNVKEYTNHWSVTDRHENRAAVVYSVEE